MLKIKLSKNIVFDCRGKMTEIINEQFVNAHLVDKLIQLFDEPTYENLSNILIYSIQFVGNFEKLPGETKKKVVIASITRFVDISNISGELEPIVLKTLPVMIDHLISVDKHTITLNPKAKGLVRKAWTICKTVFSRCACCY